MKKFSFSLVMLVCGTSSEVLAQFQSHDQLQRNFPPGTIVQRQSNTTGNGADYVIAPGATGAETIFSNSAAGGNAGQPERAVPQGGAGGGNSGGGR